MMRRSILLEVACLAGLTACGSDASGTYSLDAAGLDALDDAGLDAGSSHLDASLEDAATGLPTDAGSSLDAALPIDAALPTDAALPADAALLPTDAGSSLDAALPTDAALPIDAALPTDAAPPADANSGVLTGGPCLSGAAGSTAYRVRWLGSGGTAYVNYEINGLPDTSRDRTSAYGNQIGYTASYVDTFLAEGGLQLNGSNFIDIELSTEGLSSIQSATISIFGRSYNTTTSGSFRWQSFDGVGSAPTNLVANSAPYQWYSADMSTEIQPGDDGVLLRIKAGPSSNSLVVRRIELCLQAQ